METPEQPKILFSVALDKIKQYSDELKVIKNRLRETEGELKELNKYIEDVDSGEATSSAEERPSFSRTRAVLVDKKGELELHIEYYKGEKQRLEALIEHEGAKDQFMQDEMDNIPPGKD